MSPGPPWASTRFTDATSKRGGAADCSAIATHNRNSDHAQAWRRAGTATRNNRLPLPEMSRESVRIHMILHQYMERLPAAPSVYFEVPVESENVARAQLVSQMNQASIRQIYFPILVFA